MSVINEMLAHLSCLVRSQCCLLHLGKERLHRRREASLKSRKISALFDLHLDQTGIGICFSLLDVCLRLVQILFGMFS